MNNNDPFSSVRLKPRQIEQPIEDVSNRNNSSQEDPFSDVRLKKAEGFPYLYETGRHAARLGSRIAETVGGIPGDVSKLIQSGLFAGLESLTGMKIPEAVKESKRQRFPTSSELKEKSQEISGGYTAPQNDIEKSFDEVSETVAGLLGPMKFRKALQVGVGSSLAKEGIKALGYGETPQEAGKLGTMFLLSTMNPGGAMKYASAQYEKANALSKGASVTAKSMESNLKPFVQELKKGVSTPSKTAVIRPTEELLNKISNGKIAVQDLTSAKRDLNTLMKDPALLKREKKLLKVLSKEIDKAIMPFEKIKPEFSKAYRPANEIYGAVMQGNKASEFVKNILGNKSVLGAIAGEAFLGHPEYIIPTAAGAYGAIKAAKAADFFTRLAKSPELQKYYIRAMSAAAREDVGALRLYADKIEEEFNQSKHHPHAPKNNHKSIQEELQE